MPTLVLRVDPARLDNPEADLHLEIPDRLVERAHGLLADDGHDYEPEGSLQIYLSTADPERALRGIVELLEEGPFHGNDLAAAVVVGVSPLDVSEALEFEVVYPRRRSGTIQRPARSTA